MIQFNLLPDVKKDYVKAKRTKRLIMTGSFLVSVGAVTVLALMFSFVQIAQKKHIDDLTKDIQSATTEIKSTEDLNKILTVQNQLALLPGLHEAKPETSRIFDYITFVSPVEVKVPSLTMYIEGSIMELSGTADSIATVNKFVDNIKAVRYFIAGSPELTTPVFSQVTTQLSGDDTGASYTINLVYDPVIFTNTHEIVLKLNNALSVEASGGAADGSQ